MNQKGVNGNGRLEVVMDPSKLGYRVYYPVVNPRARKQLKRRTFLYNVSSASEAKKKLIDTNMVLNMMKKILGEKPEAILWRKKPSDLRSELVHMMNRVYGSAKRGRYMKIFGFGQKEEPKAEINDNEGAKDEDPSHAMRFKDEPMPKKSMFAAEEESANTKVFLAPSFSGKTTLMVEELNKLTPQELAQYDKIVLFTESTAAAPLLKLDRKVRAKMMIYDRFIPQFVLLLKRINTITKNRYRFLLLLDDCLNLKGGVLIKLVLTLRNANISTVISIQYSKLLARSQRQSIHDYYIINLKLEDLEYLMSGFLASHFRDLFEREGLGSKEELGKLNYKRLAEKAMERLKGKILHFDQRHDKISIFTRD